MSIAEKPKRQKADAYAPLKQLEELVAPFGWTAVAKQHTSLLTVAGVAAALTQPALSGLPNAFWNAIAMPESLLRSDGFATLNDAKAIARTLIRSLDDLQHWLDLAKNGATNELIRDELTALPMSSDTPSGGVFTETEETSRNVSLWVGRKAGKDRPDFYGAFALEVVRRLFNISEAGAAAEAKTEPARSEVPKPKAAAKRCIDDAHQTGEAKYSSTERKAEAKLLQVEISKITPDKANDRKKFDKDSLDDLAASIRQHGILQPLLLRPDPNVLRPHGAEYLIVAGERRYRAAKMAGLTQVPAQLVTPGLLDTSLMRLEENIRREDLTPIEQAQAIERMMSEHGLTQVEIGKLIHCSQGQVSNELRLLKLPIVWQQRLSDRTIKPTLIRPLLPYTDLPQVLESISVEVKDSSEPLDDRVIKLRLRASILKNSRSMLYDSHWQSYVKPDPTHRHFKTCRPEDLKALAPRKVDCLNTWEGQERTFNLELFDRLNAGPLADRVKKYAAAKKKQQAMRTGGPQKAKSGKASINLFRHDYQLRDAIGSSLKVHLADALSGCKDKAAVFRVCLVIAVCQEGEITDEIVGQRVWGRDVVTRVLDKLVGTPSQLQDALKKACISALQVDNGPCGAEELHSLADVLGATLKDRWIPTPDVLAALTDAGLQACCKAIGIEPTQEGDELQARMITAWPAGLVPEFMLPFFGLPQMKPKKGQGAA